VWRDSSGAAQPSAIPCTAKTIQLTFQLLVVWVEAKSFGQCTPGTFSIAKPEES
jgi:hypothetical protein